MSFLHAQSCECLKSELLLFDIPPTQTTIEGSHWIHYKPISSLTDDSPIEFVVPGNGEEYIDLAHTMLSVRVSLIYTGEQKEPLPEVGVVNNFMHSIISQADIYFNQKPIVPPNNTYAYGAYIETLLNYGPAAKNSHLSTVLWSCDTANKMDDCKNGNNGLATRRLFMTNNSVDMIGHLHCDVFNQEKLLLNGVEVRVRLIRSRDSFALMDPTDSYRIRIDEANLIVRKVKISPSVQLTHSKALMKTTAKYPITRVEVKAVTLQSGIHSQSIDNILLGTIPKRIIIGFVENKAYNGDKSLNPFNFKNFGIHFLDNGNNLSRLKYPNGYCLFAFDLTPDLSANDLSHWNLIKHGSIFGFDTEPGKKYLTLGFDSSVTGSRPSDLSAALPKMLLIYTDIIEPIFTGDIQAKLLRCVSIGGEKYRYGFTEISRFSPSMYIPLLYNSFQTIEIDIRDQHGQPIPFDCGTLTAILHFKRMDQ
ncbi:uncharacterized protein F54H12.2-like [Trichogramma pretiosum]|uniref:uncharacterized protein F54H12.2-like n=1 Tax=Trichogramma pretiosum TaxID=7493 RepID=UPI000C71BB63|nr:uncharacterized protein F54H12.2-like [Trichogramma pretiosum]